MCMMASCCVTALITEGNLIVFNAGDCRAVLSRGGVTEALTRDHRRRGKTRRGREKKSSKAEKKGTGREKHGDGHSYLPFGRETSSIEKILGGVEMGYQTITNYDPPPPAEQPKVAATPHPTPPVRTAVPPVRTTPPPKAPSPPSINTSLKDSSPPKEAEPIQWHPPSRDASHATQPAPQRVPSPPPQRVSSSPRATTPVKVATPAKVPSSRFI